MLRAPPMMESWRLSLTGLMDGLRVVYKNKPLEACSWSRFTYLRETYTGMYRSHRTVTVVFLPLQVCLMSFFTLRSRTPSYRVAGCSFQYFGQTELNTPNDASWQTPSAISPR